MPDADRTAELEATSTVRLWCRSGRARKIRENAGLTLAEAADLVPTDRQTLYRWERAQSTPRGDNAVRYHAALVQLQDIVAREAASA